MAKLIYKCNYDGKICNKEIPKVDENGNIIEPKEIDKKSMGISEHCTCWESCIGCDRNFSISTAPSGRLEIECISK